MGVAPENLHVWQGMQVAQSWLMVAMHEPRGRPDVAQNSDRILSAYPPKPKPPAVPLPDSSCAALALLEGW